MDSVRALAGQLAPWQIAHALFARHAGERQRRQFARSGRSGSVERYIVRLYLGAWVTAITVGVGAGATRSTPLSGLAVGLAIVVGVRLLFVRGGLARLRFGEWRRGRTLDRSTPHAAATLRRCVAGTTDRTRLLAAGAGATDGQTARTFASLGRRAELEDVETALRATARTTPSPAFTVLCRALCGPEETLPARLADLETTQEQDGIERVLESAWTTLRTRTRPRTRRRQAEECEAFLGAVAGELRAGATLSSAVERAATVEYDALVPAFDRLAAGAAVGTPTATRIVFEEFAEAIAAPATRRELRRVAAALACDCPPVAAIGRGREPPA
ncbi:MAG: hypothetical protein U5K28_12195 [Halobacteriales archaeon]|nr:hypothetical protein [Halobacteriales archaeon]